MSAKRLIVPLIVPLTGVLILSAILVSARAETITVGPDACPAPAAITIIAGGAVEAVDLNGARRIADGVVIFYDRRLDGWASRRLFARFELAPQTGWPPEYRAEKAAAGICREAP